MSAMSVLAPAFADRLQGRQPSRIRSAIAAAMVGTTAAAVTYRMLRREPSETGEEE